MSLHPLAGKPVPTELIADIAHLVDTYYEKVDRLQPVAFGTSGHRGSSNAGSFNERHIQAITQAICDYRDTNAIKGPLYIGKDTHALSTPAFNTAIEVLAANTVDVYIQKDNGYTPTPVVSHAILTHNKSAKKADADGIVITPSHNPPEDGGFKYNPPDGGPANTTITGWIEDRANSLMNNSNHDVRKLSLEQALTADSTHAHDYIKPFVNDLENVIDMDAIKSAGLNIGVDPMGGASLQYWQPIADRYGLNIDIVNKDIDPTFKFMTVDKDGKIRMDCSSPYAMAGLIAMKENYDIAFGNDPDSDRHGIVTKSVGLMNPNHYLAAAIHYLFTNRPGWKPDAAIGKTLVSSSMIDRVADSFGQRLLEVPVGFKWFVQGLRTGTYGFGGEESAGASFLRFDGTAWTTDKDGIILDLLAAEIMAKTGKDPGEHYKELTEKFGDPVYRRIDAAANSEQKNRLKNLSPNQITANTLAGEKILQKLSNAPGNAVPIGGVKVATENGWFAARPSGTEDVYKIYAESFIGDDHLKQLLNEAQDIVDKALC